MLQIKAFAKCISVKKVKKKSKISQIQNKNIVFCLRLFAEN